MISLSCSGCLGSRLGPRCPPPSPFIPHPAPLPPLNTICTSGMKIDFFFKFHIFSGALSKEERDAAQAPFPSAAPPTPAGTHITTGHTYIHPDILPAPTLGTHPSPHHIPMQDTSVHTAETHRTPCPHRHPPQAHFTTTHSLDICCHTLYVHKLTRMPVHIDYGTPVYTNPGSGTISPQAPRRPRGCSRGDGVRNKGFPARTWPPNPQGYSCPSSHNQPNALA